MTLFSILTPIRTWLPTSKSRRWSNSSLNRPQLVKIRLMETMIQASAHLYQLPGSTIHRHLAVVRNSEPTVRILANVPLANNKRIDPLSICKAILHLIHREKGRKGKKRRKKDFICRNGCHKQKNQIYRFNVQFNTSTLQVTTGLV